MAFIEWSNSLSVGLDEIDGQHRELIGLINALSAAAEGGGGHEGLASIFASLEVYASKHFALEERYFEEFGYTGAGEHKKEHAAFVAKLGAFKAKFSSGGAGLSKELLPFLRSWLSSHIAFSDRKYKSLFASKGIR